jgi:hypothetical protein
MYASSNDVGRRWTRGYLIVERREKGELFELGRGVLVRELVFNIGAMEGVY